MKTDTSLDFHPLMRPSQGLGPLGTDLGPELDLPAIALTMLTRWPYNFAGEVAEWFKAAVLKTAR